MSDIMVFMPLYAALREGGIEALEHVVRDHNVEDLRMIFRQCVVGAALEKRLDLIDLMMRREKRTHRIDEVIAIWGVLQGSYYGDVLGTIAKNLVLYLLTREYHADCPNTVHYIILHYSYEPAELLSEEILATVWGRAPAIVSAIDYRNGGVLKPFIDAGAPLQHVLEAIPTMDLTSPSNSSVSPVPPSDVPPAPRSDVPEPPSCEPPRQACPSENRTRRGTWIRGTDHKAPVATRPHVYFADERELTTADACYSPGKLSSSDELKPPIVN